MEDKNRDNNAHWNEYWAQGHKTSFGSAFSGGYEGVIKTTWERYFSNLKAHERVLDLCTGNASLLRIASDCLPCDNKVSFTGVDYAEIEIKNVFSNLDEVNLAFNINIENLPFESKSFDHVISNFGIEYSDLNKSISEAARVLADGGKLELVCHCHDSHIIKSNSAELSMLKVMLSKDNVIDKLEGLVNALAIRAENQSQSSSEEISHFQAASKDAEKFRHDLNDKIAFVDNSYSKAFHDSEFLSFLKYLLNRTTKDKKAALALFKSAMQSHKLRLSAMVDSALTKQQLVSINEMFKVHGLSFLSLEDVLNEESKIACKISAKKLIK